MAFPILESTTNGTNTGSNITVDLPSGIQSGDLLIIFLGTASAISVTTPSGWSRFVFTNVPGRTHLLSRVADGTEGSTLTITTSSSNKGYHALRISGSTGSFENTPVGEEAKGTSNSPNPPELTPSWGSDDYLWIAFMTQNDNTNVNSYPTNYTNGDNLIIDTGFSIGYAIRQLTASSEDPGVFTLAASESWGASTVVIQPSDTPTNTGNFFLFM